VIAIEEPIRIIQGLIVHQQTDPGFLISFAPALAIKNRSGKIAHRFLYENRSVNLISESKSDVGFPIDQRFCNYNRDHDQNYSGKIAIRF